MRREGQNLAKYDVIGKSYNVTRRADQRITDIIINSLGIPANASILDVGAGTGNYSVQLANKGFEVIAVEPSKVMREIGNMHPNLKWFEGTAEDLPLEDSSVDGIICTLAIHHFSDLNKSFKEMVRVVKSKGKIVLFVADPRLCPDDSCWLKDYFKPIILQAYRAYKPIQEIVRMLGHETKNVIQIIEFPVPFDINDCFFASAWRRPELYLEQIFRSGVSPLAKCPDDILQPLLDRLRRDLVSGKWDGKYGHYRSMDTYEGGYRFLISEKVY